jgi:hypothetical protein
VLVGEAALGAWGSGRKERRTFSYVVAALVQLPLSGVSFTIAPDVVEFNSLLPRRWPIREADPMDAFDETVLVRLGACEFDERE